MGYPEIIIYDRNLNRVTCTRSMTNPFDVDDIDSRLVNLESLLDTARAYLKLDEHVNSLLAFDAHQDAFPVAVITQLQETLSTMYDQLVYNCEDAEMILSPVQIITLYCLIENKMIWSSYGPIKMSAYEEMTSNGPVIDLRLTMYEAGRECDTGMLIISENGLSYETTRFNRHCNRLGKFAVEYFPYDADSSESLRAHGAIHIQDMVTKFKSVIEHLSGGKILPLNVL